MRMIETFRSVFKRFSVNFRSLNEYVYICWCINQINYRLHGATLKIKILSCNEMILVAQTTSCSVGTEFLNIILSEYCDEGLKIYIIFFPIMSSD